MRELFVSTLILCLTGVAVVTVAAGKQALTEQAYLAAIGQSGPHSENWSGMRE